jgi:hypothetical protein
MERERVDDLASPPEPRLCDLLPLHVEPVADNNLEGNLRVEILPLPELTPEFPQNGSFPLAPRIASTPRPKPSSRTPGLKVRLRVGNSRPGPMPLRTPRDGKAPTARGDGLSSRNSVWGNLHKYLRSIVGCLILSASARYNSHLPGSELPTESQPLQNACWIVGNHG